MAKIRGFKPDLWTDEDFVEVSSFARLLWMGMWSFACDNGHIADKSKQIKMRVLPTDDVNCAELLRELETQGLIHRVEGWITIPNLTRHQKIDRRFFTTCEKPECAAPEANPKPETRRAHVETTTSARRDHAGTRGDGDGDGDGELNGSDGDRRKRPSRPLPTDWSPTETHQKYATTNKIDIEREAFKFRNHAIANDRRQVNWNATFSTWLAKATEWAPPAKARPAGVPEGW